MKKTLILSCALALAGLSNVAMAADGGQGFVRAELGRSEVDVFGENDNDTAYSIRGGYFFNANIGVEGFYSSLYDQNVGTFDTTLTAFGAGVVGKKNFGADGNGFFIGARAGVSRLTAQVREDEFEVLDDESSTKPFVGLNVGYDFNESWGLSLNYDVRRADFDGADVDVDTLSLGGEWRF